jgi:preprotein translocase subunit SecB
MEVVKKSPFRLDQFIVKEFNITREPVKQGKIDFGIKPSGIIDDNNRIFQLSLEFFVKDNTGSFDIKLIAIGFFEFKADMSADTLSNYFYTNASAIIFPYIRAYISSITALSGLKAVNLPVMNLSNLKDQLKANTIKKAIIKIQA